MQTITPDQLPDPTTLIAYPDGSVGALMFHFATEGDFCDVIAKEQGYECKYLCMDDDLGEDDPVYKAYWEGDADMLKEWKPTVPDGWLMGAKYHSEDGAIACFIRRQS